MAWFAPAVAVTVWALASGAPAGADAAPDLDLRAQTPPPSEIVGGEQTEPLEFGAVVALLNDQRGLCTGTVVEPRLILTAAHCLMGLGEGATITVFFGNEMQSDMSVAASGFGLHPEFCEDCREDIYDYGYLEIPVDFTPPDGFILPITDQDEWDEVMRNGHEVILVGFGKDPNADDPDASLGIKRKVTTTIRKFSEEGLEFFAGANGKDSCQGDSGGPAFVRLENGALRLAGITSRGSDPCGDGGFYGAPYAALPWVRDETGVDLLPEDCEDATCLDTSPPPVDDGRCSIGAVGAGGLLPWLLPLLLARPRRRRRG